VELVPRLQKAAVETTTGDFAKAANGGRKRGAST
jgi:hypothetical protein